MKNRRIDMVSYFRQMQVKFSRLYTQILNDSDLTLPQYTLLGEIAASGPIPMTEASCKLHISKPAVTHLVDRLEKKKMLKRQAHPQDRRVDLLQITPLGKKGVLNTQSKVLSYLLNTLKRFDAQDQKTILLFYSMLSSALDQALNSRKQKCA